MDKIFRIGDFCFRLIMPDNVQPPKNFMLFEQAESEPAYTYTIELGQSVPGPRGRMVAQRRDIVVFEENGLEMRYIGFPDGQGIYACYREVDPAHASIFLAPGILPMLMVDTVFLSLFCMERHMLRMDHLVLHCAYMQREGQAILFSAPSETGKTTQATLWGKHRGTRVVNGDKSLLTKNDGVWTANGWPVCGSSEVCHNESMPIRAIVMLSQGKTDTIEKLSPFQAFSKIYSQITVNFWNKAAQKKAMDLIEELVTSIPVYHLSCTISEDAVICLENMLIADEKKDQPRNEA